MSGLYICVISTVERHSLDTATNPMSDKRLNATNIISANVMIRQTSFIYSMSTNKHHKATHAITDKRHFMTFVAVDIKHRRKNETLKKLNVELYSTLVVVDTQGGGLYWLFFIF